MARRPEEAMNPPLPVEADKGEGHQHSRHPVPHSRIMCWACVIAALIAAMIVCVTSTARAEPLDEMSLERWKKLREAERYQLNIAEKYYRAQDYKVALTEYEKYLRLYEKSEAAPYAQLKWSLCQVQRRQQNTAIREGFQSILDYWPDTPEATAAAYYIGSTYKGMGEITKAKKAYAVVLAKHANHIAAVFARTDLADIARVEKDDKTRATLWRELTFDVKRTPETVSVCQEASRNLAAYYFSTGAFAEGKEALATTYTGEGLPPQVMQYIAGPISTLAAATATKPSGEKLADQAIAFLREQMPADLKDDAAKARAKLYWFYIADCYSYSLRHAEVPKVYEQMQKTFGVADDILGRLAGWYRSQNRRDEARATYGRFANRPEGLNQVGHMYREEQKWDLAINTFREIAGLDQKNFATWEGQIAYTYRLAGKLDESINTYQALIKKDAAHAGSWQWEIATTYRHFGKLKEAIASYRLCENAPQNYWEMAICHRALKQYGEALILYQQTIGSHPDWAPRSQLQIGYTYEEAAKAELAIKAFQAVCSRYPKSGEASESHAHLENKYKINTGGGAKAGAEKE
jgi:tetratricopeptide (TPR) repeat protein